MSISAINGGGPVPAGARANVSNSDVVPMGALIEDGFHQIERRSQEMVQSAARTIELFARDMGRSLDFAVDSSSGKQIVRVTNPSTGEVVRQIPSEEVVQIARSLNYLQNVLVNVKA